MLAFLVFEFLICATFNISKMKFLCWKSWKKFQIKVSLERIETAFSLSFYLPDRSGAKLFIRPEFDSAGRVIR